MTRAKATSRAKKKSLADIFFDFVQENPRAAAALALQLGIWAGHSTGRLAKFKKLAKIPPKLLHAMPLRVTDAALKLLPHPSPAIQPHLITTKRRKRRKDRRKPA